MPPTPSSLLKSPVIDTSMLFDFLVWRFFADRQVPIPKSLLELVSSRPLKELGWCLDAAKPIQTSSQVIAEVYFLAKKRWKFPDGIIDPFWRLARQEFEQIELVERFIPLNEMDYGDFIKYGPTDASILTLGARQDAAVLVNDNDLRGACIEREIHFLDYNKILSLWQQLNA